MRSKTANLNSLYEIKLHIFIWSLYPKDLLSNAYNLIHVYYATTSYYPSEYTSTLLKECKSSTLDSTLESFEWKIKNGVAR